MTAPAPCDSDPGRRPRLFMLRGMTWFGRAESMLIQASTEEEARRMFVIIAKAEDLPGVWTAECLHVHEIDLSDSTARILWDAPE